MSKPRAARPSVLVAAALSAGLFAGCQAQPDYPECKSDPGCAAHGQVCVAGSCRQCRDDGQCKPGEQCVNGGCFAKAECSAETPCAAGMLCRGGKCAPECTEATGAADCGFARKCVANRCVADETCSGDGECGMGSACVDGRCRAQAGITGTAVSDAAVLSCVAGPIYFSFDEPTLDSRARDALERAWACVQHEGFRRLRLEGNTDERGTTEYNLALGSRRAEAVRKYLIGLGAEGRKLRSVSFGKERPRDPGHDESAWARNRRVDIDLEK